MARRRKPKTVAASLAMHANAKSIIFIGILLITSPCAATTTDEWSYPGFLQLGYSYASLTQTYADWNDIELRWYQEVTRRDHIDIELGQQRHFADTGTVYGIRYLTIFNQDWYGSLHWSSSRGGFFLPENRVDGDINRKWLTQKNLITSFGVTYYRAKDIHTDRSARLSALYYFSLPLIAELGLRANASDPGFTLSQRYFTSITYGVNKHYYLGARYDAGNEAYQLVGANTVVNDFNSSELMLSWRQWLSHGSGFELSGSRYTNPSYERSGAKLLWFYEY